MQGLRTLECGHAVQVDAYDDDDCPFCEDYADAFALDLLADAFDGDAGRVIPHTRQ